MSQWRERARRVLAERFGHREFLGPQAAIIEHVLGGGDALVVMPTGGGKSLCYQLPALLKDGVTIVLSPLIALMQDQVDQLRLRGLPATFINSSLDRRERDARLAATVAGEYRILYVTPERFRKEEFTAAIAKVRVALLAVDEAHCISTWGHDFRPEYSRLGRIHEFLGNPPTIALTATATPETQQDIRRQLGIPAARLFHTGIERPNLFVGVREVHDEDQRLARILEIIGRVAGPGIVYLSLIKDLRVLQDRLWQEGVDCLVYHGDLTAAERRRMQREFSDSSDAIILATNAFGMGVDKADIRFILHAQIPGSVEAYYQEIGRAGRDGGNSICELLYLQDDLMIQKQFVEWANPDAAFLRNQFNLLARWGDHLYAKELQDLRESLLVKNRADGRPEMVMGLLRAEGIIAGSFEQRDLQIVRPLAAGEENVLIDAGKRDRDLRKLLEIVEYARTTECRKSAIHTYFGFEWDGVGCGSCDLCLPTETRLASFSPRRAGHRREQCEEAPVSPGDWLLVKGRFTVTVKSVTRRKGTWVIQAQDAGDLRIRQYVLERIDWRRVERD